MLLPPLGLILLWKDSQRPGRKIFGSFVILLYCLPYSALIVWLLIKFTGLQVEWRGGFPPVLTYSKTVPNYDAVEKNRAEQTRLASAVVTNRAAATAPPYWTDFRGPNRDGHYSEAPILTNWPATGLRELWREPIGGGYGSFVVAQGLAFTIEQRRELEVVAAYDLETGREVWTNGWGAFFQESMGGDGARATPTYHEGKIYAQGAEGEFRCLDASKGKLIWSKNILADNKAENLKYGMASSPLVVDDKVIVQAGGGNGSSVAAYNQLTGKTVWKSLDDQAAYSSPMTVNLAGQRQLLIATEKRVVGLAIEDGRLLWEHAWVVKLGNRNIAQPVILSSNRFFLSAGYGTGCEAVEISKGDPGYSAHTLWKNTFLKNKFTSSVFWQGYIYGLDEDILTCLNAETGERQWKDGRYGYGQLLLADGYLIVLSGEGELALVKATPERHIELARFSAIHGKTWNHPAIAEGRLLVRNAVEAACFDLSGR
ncbi:MAG TPA: PQQ-binding-like beta-propeller repeat protein [Verrucomicrobiae bacterium]|nr:PQQ-binding-like beta-propeller repeat protein [Verrucomicrobiae bacterium]